MNNLIWSSIIRSYSIRQLMNRVKDSTQSTTYLWPEVTATFYTADHHFNVTGSFLNNKYDSMSLRVLLNPGMSRSTPFKAGVDLSTPVTFPNGKTRNNSYIAYCLNYGNKYEDLGLKTDCRKVNIVNVLLSLKTRKHMDSPPPIILDSVQQSRRYRLLVLLSLIPCSRVGL